MTKDQLRDAEAKLEIWAQHMASKAKPGQSFELPRAADTDNHVVRVFSRYFKVEVMKRHIRCTA